MITGMLRVVSLPSHYSSRDPPRYWTVLNGPGMDVKLSVTVHEQQIIDAVEEELRRDAVHFAEELERCTYVSLLLFPPSMLNICSEFLEPDKQGPDDISSACVNLYNTTCWQRPTSLEYNLTSVLLSQCAARRIIVIHAIIVASIKWSDLELWAKTVHFCCAKNCTSFIRPTWLMLAMGVFGLSKLKPM